MDLNPLRGVPGARSSYALRFGAALFVVLLVVGVFGGVIYAHTGSELEDDVESLFRAAIADEVNELSTTEEIAATSSQVATLAERTAATSTDARESARRAIDGMNAIEAEANEAVAEVGRLEDELETIDDLLAFIGDVTRETNMLALNASIEAATQQQAAAT